MKLSGMIGAGILALAAMTGTADAQMATRTTTVTKVHGPLKILPHHNRKICNTRWVHHRKMRKCYYH